MMDVDDVNRVVMKASLSTLKPLEPSRVLVERTMESDGAEAFQVTIVFDEHDINSVTGDAALETKVRIRQELLALGEDRFAFVNFAAENELMSHDDP